MDRDNKLYEALVTGRAELFRSVDERIRGRELTPEEKARRERMEERRAHTEAVANSILKLVINTFSDANAEYGPLEITDENFGTLSTVGTYGGKTTGYHVNDDGLTINLNYTRSFMWEQTHRVSNFANSVDWEYLKEILEDYHIDIEREERSENAGDSYRPVMIYFDTVVITVKNNIKERKY